METEAATELIQALETIARISEEDSRDLAESRDKAERVRGMFEQRLKEKLAGKGGPSSDLQDLLASSTPGLANGRSRMALRESCFLNAFHSLMRLYADPETREIAETIFGLLTEIRMVGFADELSLSPTDVPRLIPESDEKDPEARRRAVLSSALDHQSHMRDFMQKRQAAYDTQIDRSRALLQEALTAARTLL